MMTLALMFSWCLHLLLLSQIFPFLALESSIEFLQLLGGPDRKIESGKIEPSALLFWYLTFLQYEQPKLGGVCYLFSGSRTPERQCGSCIRLVADEDLSRNRNSRLSIFPFPTMHWLDTHIRAEGLFSSPRPASYFFRTLFHSCFCLR